MSAIDKHNPAVGGQADAAGERPAGAGPDRPPELAGPPERAAALIDLGAIDHNVRHLRSLLADGAQLCAVVKADGYGHGAAPIARTAQWAGATWLAVATGAEAAELRDHGVPGRLLVMGALTTDDAALAAGSDADVVAWDAGFARKLAEVASRAGGTLSVHVKLDTGMGRLGTKDADAALALCDQVAADRRLELAGVMTHFATADEPGDDLFPAQLRMFGEFVAAARARHPSVLAHAANSAAVYRDAASHFDIARCGIAVYGLDPFHATASERGLRPALELRSYVADVKPFSAGESAGYGRRWRARGDTLVAVLPIGYGDGVRRGLGGNTDVLIRGRRHPLVGTVSMDNVTVDLGPETDVRPGDRAVLIGADGGERLSCEELADRLATINYEVACGLSGRVARRYLRP